MGRVLEGRGRPTPALCFVGDLGPARSFLLVPAPSPPIPLAESAVEDGPAQDRKANPAPVGGTQAAHQPRASWSRSLRVQGLHLRPSVPWSSVPCGTQRRCQCWSPTSVEELVSQEPLVFVGPRNCSVAQTSGRSSTPHFAIQGSPNMDGSAEAVRRHRGRGLPPRTQAGPQFSEAESHLSQATYPPSPLPMLLLNFPHPKAGRGLTGPEDTAYLPMCQGSLLPMMAFPVPTTFFQVRWSQERKEIGAQ